MVYVSCQTSHADTHSNHETETISTPPSPSPQVKPDLSTIHWCNPPEVTQNCVIAPIYTSQETLINLPNRPPIIDAIPNGLKPHNPVVKGAS